MRVLSTHPQRLTSLFREGTLMKIKHALHLSSNNLLLLQSVYARFNDGGAKSFLDKCFES